MRPFKAANDPVADALSFQPVDLFIVGLHFIAARIIETPDRRPANVDPVERLLALVPERTFAEDVGLLADALHGGCGRRHRGR